MDIPILIISISSLCVSLVTLIVVLAGQRKKSDNDITPALEGFKSELQKDNRDSRTEMLNSVQSSMNNMGKSIRDSLSDKLDEFKKTQSENFANLSKTIADVNKQITETQDKLYVMQEKKLDTMSEAQQKLLAEQLKAMRDTLAESLAALKQQFADMREENTKATDALKGAVEKKLEQLQKDNTAQLDKMRETVDEKLDKTLNDRISKSFNAVNERLSEVYRGLGEMTKLASDVGDLKKVMSNVKTRGILGELALGAIMEEMLTPDQYDTNVATKEGSANRVEFAIKLPGDGDGCVYLPVDSKFPSDVYLQLQDAYDSGDSEAIKAAHTALEQRIKSFAKDIHDKYIDPPNTTNFGIMFLPYEGLYSEVVRCGLVDELQQKYQISIAGPTTFSALLNSLRMGFRTLAIQKRSDEVWQVLGAVKTEFGTFKTALDAAQKRIDMAGKDLEKLVGTRTNAINRKLRSITELPMERTKEILPESLSYDEETEEDKQ